jgi:hypothetical protein
MSGQCSGVILSANPAEDRHLVERATADHAIAKQQWVRRHATQMLQCWLRWQTPLGIAPGYVAKLERDLARCYDQPLLRTFIERTY